MPSTHLRRERPLDGVTSITVKIGLLVVLSIVAAVVLMQVGSRAGVPGWITLPVALAGALGVSRWLARGMTSPLREMTRAAGQMAAGDYSARVPATSADEVGRLGHAFNTMAADLAAADQERRQLVATVSHELRTPLAAQRALLENLVDGVVTPDDTALQTALAQSERLSGLVSDLLDVSRIDG
ncbi:HAMP domain-containing protein, partial [Ornithinicoccus hortensis]